MTKLKRGMAACDQATRDRVSKLGGNAPHPNGRGMQKVNKKRRTEIARLGGLARHKNR